MLPDWQQLLTSTSPLPWRCPQERPGKDAPSTLKSLAAYLTLEKAQRMHGYDAAKLGLSDAKAAEIAAVFSAFDKGARAVCAVREDGAGSWCPAPSSRTS